MDVLSEANAMVKDGIDIAYLCVGQPSAKAPVAAREAAKHHLEHQSIGYTDAAGRSDLKLGLSRYLGEKYSVDVSPDRIMITTGSSAAFNLAFLTLFNPGDRVVMTSPGYPAYRNILKALSLEAVELPISEANRWTLNVDAIREAYDEKPFEGLLLASPANPNGTMISRLDLHEICDCCQELGIKFISDEIYHGLSYPETTGMTDVSALQFTDQAIVINSFSKYFCMTGWRIGWMVLPPELVRPVEVLSQSLYISAPELSQVAALHALDALDELEHVRQSYLANRNLLLEKLPLLGISDIAPIDGAFYAYANVLKLTNNSDEFAKQLLREAHVAVTPGKDFDPVNGNQFVRFSFAGDFSVMENALGRIQSYIGNKAE